MNDSSTALLLIAHGSRLRKANEDLDHLASEIRQRGIYALVQPSYLELSEPGIEAGGANCVQPGIAKVIMLPYFLSAGIHVRDDLTAARDRLSERFPNVQFVMAEPLGRHPALIEIVLDRAGEAVI